MPHRVVVLGAGYAGLGAATRLARLTPDSAVHTTLVNRADRFVERVRLHQIAAGQDVTGPLLAEVLRGTGVELVVGSVTGIDLERGTVRVGTARDDIPFDTLVYALGSEADVGSVPGAAELTCRVASAEDALALRARLEGLRAGRVVAVVGGGMTGIEAAAEVAEARTDLHVELISADPIGYWLTPRARQYLRRSLVRMGITVREHWRIAEVTKTGLRLEGGQRLPADLVVWAAGFRVPALAARAGLAVDERDRMLVDDRLRSTSHPHVYGVGDAATAPTPGDAAARMSCQTGLPMGQYAARAIAESLRGHDTRPVRIRHVWQNLSLGRRDGITQFMRPDDRPVPVVLTGRVSARFKEVVTRSAVWSTTR